jgi:hypothetical protein
MKQNVNLFLLKRYREQTLKGSKDENLYNLNQILLYIVYWSRMIVLLGLIHGPQMPIWRVKVRVVHQTTPGGATSSLTTKENNLASSAFFCENIRAPVDVVEYSITEAKKRLESTKVFHLPKLLCVSSRGMMK